MNEMETMLRARLERAITEWVFPGAVAGIVNAEGRRSMVSVGAFTYEASPQVADHTVYDVASITKSIPTSSIALALIEEGALDLDAPLLAYLPEYASNYRDLVLIRHLLTYSVILNLPTPGFSIERATSDEIRTTLMRVNLRYPPGERAQYSNSPALLLTMAIERVTGKSLDTLADAYFFKPLGMAQSTFSPQSPESIPPTEIDDWRGLVQGVVHDETSYVLSRERPSGCAGLFTSVPDILTFLQMLLNEGAHEGRRYFSPDMVRAMHTNQLSGHETSMGLGWELHEPRFMGAFATERTFGKTGFTGTVCVIDPDRKIAFTLLSNRTYPKRGSADPIHEVRRDIADIVLSSVWT